MGEPGGDFRDLDQPQSFGHFQGIVPWPGVAEGHRGQRERFKGGDGEGLNGLRKIKVGLIGP